MTKFKLYHSGQLSASRAISDLKNILNEKLKDTYSLEIIDVTKTPVLAVRVNVFATLTLIKQSPPPLTVFVGNLTDRERLASAVEFCALKSTCTGRLS